LPLAQRCSSQIATGTELRHSLIFRGDGRRGFSNHAADKKDGSTDSTALQRQPSRFDDSDNKSATPIARRERFVTDGRDLCRADVASTPMGKKA
jgi:hypothetical protein